MNNNYSDFSKARDYVSPTLLNGTTDQDTTKVLLNKVFDNIYEKLSVTAHQIKTFVTEFRWINENSIKNDLSLRISDLNEYIGKVKKGETVQPLDFDSWVNNIRTACNILDAQGKHDVLENIPEELEKLEKNAQDTLKTKHVEIVEIPL